MRSNDVMNNKSQHRKSNCVFGPYSQAIKTDTLVFISGQLPIKPSTGDIVAGNIKEETRQVLANLKEVLA